MQLKQDIIGRIRPSHADSLHVSQWMEEIELQLLCQFLFEAGSTRLPPGWHIEKWWDGPLCFICSGQIKLQNSTGSFHFSGLVCSILPVVSKLLLLQFHKVKRNILEIMAETIGDLSNV